MKKPFKLNSRAASWDQYFELPNMGLKAFLESVELGSDNVLYGAFCDVKSEQDVSNVMKEWSRTLDTIEQQYPSLYAFENDMLSKVGPMSLRKPLSERMDDINSYYECIKSKAEPVNPAAIDLTIKEFNPIRGLQVRSQKRTVEKMRKSTNSGSPYFTKRRAVLHKTLPIFRIYVPSHSYMLKGTMWHYCAILGWRGQEGGPSEQDVKQRVVWMFPFGINVCELQVYQPLVEACQRFNLVAPWISMEAVDERITNLFDSKGSEDLVICTDFTKFDQHFNPTLADCAKILLEHILARNENSAKWLREVFYVKYTIPLCIAWDRILTGWHGMGSGSGGTNADETLVHRCLQHEAALTDNAVLNPFSMCLGDDGVLSYPGCSTEHILETYTKHGLEMNEAKQYVSKEDCVFLRRWHHKDYRVDGKCVGVYSTYRALGRLMYRERFHKNWDAEKEALRTLSILENCKYHPLADEFASFVMKRDRYRLGKDIPGFFDKLSKLNQETIDIMSDYVSYTSSLNPETGISHWWIVQYVQSH